MIGNDYLRLRQICLVAPELASAVDVVQTVLGLSVAHRDPELSEYGLENAVFPVADRFLEIVAPIQPNTPATRFLDKGARRGGYIVIFDCDDPQARGARAGALGVRVVNVFALPEFTGIQLHPRDCRAAMLEFDRSRDGYQLGGAYWPAGPDWQAYVDTSVTARLAGIDIASASPVDLAAHWARIMNVTPTAGEVGSFIRVDEQTIRFVHDAGAVREVFATVALEVQDPAGMLETARTCGLDTASDTFDFCGVTFRLSASANKSAAIESEQVQ